MLQSLRNRSPYSDVEALCFPPNMEVRYENGWFIQAWGDGDGRVSGGVFRRGFGGHRRTISDLQV